MRYGTKVLLEFYCGNVTLAPPTRGGLFPKKGRRVLSTSRSKRRSLKSIMYERKLDIHVRAIRLAQMGLRRDILRYMHGEFIVRHELCSVLTAWFAEYERQVDDAKRIMGDNVKKQETNMLNWKGFKDFKLTADQLQLFAAWDCHDGDALDLVQGALAGGYKLTFTYNGKVDSYNASLTCNAENNPNQGYTMSAFAPTFYQALRLLMFKHWELLGSDWDNVPPPQKGGLG